MQCTPQFLLWKICHEILIGLFGSHLPDVLICSYCPTCSRCGNDAPDTKLHNPYLTPPFDTAVEENWVSDILDNDNPGKVSFQLHGLIFSLLFPELCGSEHLAHRERPVATQHSLRNCVDHLATLSHIGHTIRCKFGFLYTFIHQSRGNDSITFRFFWCPGVFAIAMVSFSS